MFERQVVAWFLLNGGRIGFFRGMPPALRLYLLPSDLTKCLTLGDIKKLTEDIMLLKPTIFPSVPRLLNRIYDKVVSEDVSV